ncbi:hypothetical protein ACJX0J_040682 [Zea mays]
MPSDFHYSPYNKQRHIIRDDRACKYPTENDLAPRFFFIYHILVIIQRAFHKIPCSIDLILGETNLEKGWGPGKLQIHGLGNYCMKIITENAKWNAIILFSVQIRSIKSTGTTAITEGTTQLREDITTCLSCMEVSSSPTFFMFFYVLNSFAKDLQVLGFYLSLSNKGRSY